MSFEACAIFARSGLKSDIWAPRFMATCFFIHGVLLGISSTPTARG